MQAEAEYSPSWRTLDGIPAVVQNIITLIELSFSPYTICFWWAPGVFSLPQLPPFSLSYLHFYISLGLLYSFSDTTTWSQLCILDVCPCSEVKATENVVPSWEVGGWSLQSCSTGVGWGLSQSLEWNVNKANKWGIDKGKEGKGWEGLFSGQTIP